MRSGAVLLTVALCVAGCALFQGEAEPELASGQKPVLAADQIDRLDLATVREVFPPDQAVTMERIERSGRPDDQLLTGRHAFDGRSSITVRIYEGEKGGEVGLNVQLEGEADAYELVEPTLRFPFKWWHKEGPPATIVYDYGNAVVMILSADLDPARIVKDGAKAARAVALRILRCSKGLPATPE